MINITNLTQKNKDCVLLNDINLNVEEKTVFGILCGESSGKTTLMEVLAGITTITEGDVSICGHNMATDREKAQMLIGYMPEKMPFYKNMTVIEYLSFVAEAKQLSYEEAQKNIKNTLTKTSLLGVRNAVISKLNSEGKARLGIAQAIVSDPPVLLLDNPTCDLDKKETDEIFKLIKTVSKSKTVIITSDNPDIFSFCDKLAMLSLGQIDFNTKNFLKGEKK